MGDMTFVDLSVPIQEPLEGELEGELAKALAAKIDYEDHTQSLPIITRIFGCEPEDLPDGQGWANEMVTLSTHAGTHMDAPWHYFPTCEGEPVQAHRRGAARGLLRRGRRARPARARARRARRRRGRRAPPPRPRAA